MPAPHKHRILQHVTHDAYEPRRIEALAEELGVAPDELEDFRHAIDELVESGQVVIGASDTVALPPMGREVTGRFKLNERGFGFLIPDTTNAHGDLFVPAGHTGNALTGDRVKAKVVYERGGRPGGKSPYTGRVIEILQRGSSTFVGTLEKRGTIYAVIVDGKALRDPVIVRDVTSKSAVPGDKVVVELTQYPEDGYTAEGVITEVLGKTGEPDVETDAICRAYNIAEKFPAEVIDQAREMVWRYEKSDRDKFMSGRLDLRNDYIITIDPPDAKDYDDAISVSHTDRGVELGVHIADVAAFVPLGSALDREARQRGNSAYLPRRVVPMLPEILSNGVCSLMPGVERLTRSAFMTYNEDGKPIASRFATSIIKSAHRLTYIEAQALIDGDLELARKHAKYDAPYTDKLIETLRQMEELSQRIRKRRLRDGMIVLDLPEVDLVYDETGRVIDAQPEDDAYTHKLIEAFMVEANEAVARVFADLDVPLIRRIHPDPGAHDITELRVFARVAGFNIPANPTRKQLQALLDATRGKPSAQAVHFAVLRTLTKAEYAPDHIGHFALASEHYTHFTSPIRRYPDLAVHRAFDALMEKLEGKQRIPGNPPARKKLGRELMSDKRILDDAELRELGRHCSATERNAEAAERELRSLLVMQLLENHVGDDFEGTVTGVTGFGVYIQINKYLVEGLIRMPDLPGGAGERWVLNKMTGSLVAQRSGRAITIGDRFTVRISKVDLTRREMGLLIIEGERFKTPVEQPQKYRREERQDGRRPDGKRKGKYPHKLDKQGGGKKKQGKKKRRW